MKKIEEIKLMNETMINYLKDKGLDIKRNEIIKQILQDEACFFKMSKEEAYIVLTDVGVKKNIDEMYLNLIGREEFYRLQQCGKINEDDNLEIKYGSYCKEDLFKNRQRF